MRNPRHKTPRYRVSLVREAGSFYTTSRPIKDPRYIYKMSKQLFGDMDREAFYVVALDQQLKMIGINLVSLGTLTASLVHPREIFKALILLNAANFIGVHNHPSSGAPMPSAQDVDLTKRLAMAGRLLGISMRDHVIIGEGNFFSFADAGLMPQE